MAFVELSHTEMSAQNCHALKCSRIDVKIVKV